MYDSFLVIDNIIILSLFSCLCLAHGPVLESRIIGEKNRGKNITAFSYVTIIIGRAKRCSIEISRDIYVCVGCGPKSVGIITWAEHAHAQSQYIGW